MLDPTLCRARQKRLLDRLQSEKLDAVVVGLTHHVYYFSAFYPHWLHSSAFVLLSDGRSWLASGNSPARDTAAEEVVAFQANWSGTLRQEQPSVVADHVLERLRRAGARRIGIDASSVCSQILLRFEGEALPIDSSLWQMRRAKDADELALIRTAVRASEAMFARAREIIEPGVPELHVFTQLHEAAVKSTGEPMTALLGNDYACGAAGGKPRADRKAQAGEIYVLDLGPTYRGYFADDCRAFSVDREPTDAQISAWQSIVKTFDIVEAMAKPGVRCREVYEAVDRQLKLDRGQGMPHHLGHGVGLQPHEFPHLNPNWDDVLIEGEVFTAEPGQYGPELASGIRIENIYVVTKDGVNNLLSFPMELV